jgi:hypothetical protein
MLLPMNKRASTGTWRMLLAALAWGPKADFSRREVMRFLSRCIFVRGFCIKCASTWR